MNDDYDKYNIFNIVFVISILIFSMLLIFFVEMDKCNPHMVHLEKMNIKFDVVSDNYYAISKRCDSKINQSVISNMNDFDVTIRCTSNGDRCERTEFVNSIKSKSSYIFSPKYHGHMGFYIYKTGNPELIGYISVRD